MLSFLWRRTQVLIPLNTSFFLDQVGVGNKVKYKKGVELRFLIHKKISQMLDAKPSYWMDK